MTIWEQLADPFPPEVVGWKPQAISKDETRCMVAAYIDARDVMNRLDAVVGPANWTDSYQFLDGGNVLCRLSIRIPAGVGAYEWISREDVGGPSDQRDVGDKLKAAVSDALKRAAVKFGIGRYLYSLPTQWVPYDKNKRQPVSTPGLPQQGLPEAARDPVPETMLADMPTMLSAVKEAMKRAGMHGWDKLLHHFAYGAAKEIPVREYKPIMDWLDTLVEPVKEPEPEKPKKGKK